MSDAREATLDFAVKLRGKCGEQPPGSNHNFITEWYGIDGPWCDMGVSYVFAKTDQEEEGKHAYTPEHAQSFKDRKRAVSKSELKRGDVAFMDFPDSLARIQHVGLVLQPQHQHGKLIGYQLMEFNTSSGTAGSQDDGGDGYIRSRPLGVIVVGGRPDFNGNVEKPIFDFPSKAWFGIGDAGADVKLWKRDLRQWARDLKSPDFNVQGFIEKLNEGVPNLFDENTARATKTFQFKLKLDVDGRVGAQTIRVMERVRTNQEGR